jgi:biopolymer transport protein ExbD
MKLRDAYNRDDKKSIAESLKLINERKKILNITNEQVENVQKTSSEDRIIDYSKSIGTKQHISSVMDAWKNQDFESLAILAETLFKKLKRKIWEGISSLGWIGYQIIGNKNVEALEKSISADWTSNYNTILSLQNQIKQKGGTFTKGNTDTQEKQEDYIIALTQQLGTLNKSMKEQIKAVKDQTGATKENTNTIKDTANTTKQIDFKDLFSSISSIAIGNN